MRDHYPRWIRNDTCYVAAPLLRFAAYVSHHNNIFGDIIARHNIDVFFKIRRMIRVRYIADPSHIFEDLWVTEKKSRVRHNFQRLLLIGYQLLVVDSLFGIKRSPPQFVILCMRVNERLIIPAILETRINQILNNPGHFNRIRRII